MSSWFLDLNCLSVISALSNTHLIMSVYGSILGVAAIQCKNEHASLVSEASDDLRESVVALTSIILGFSFSSRLYMPSQVDMLASLVQVVSVNKGVISLSSATRSFPFFPITFFTLLRILFFLLLLQVF